MFEYGVDFASPWYLCLLALIPILWWLSYRSLSGLGRIRRFVALALRSAVLTAIVFALAEIQLTRTSEHLTVMYLVDQSLSISSDQSAEMLKFINAAIRTQRRADPQDRAGVIVFGREAAIEIPPLDDDQQVVKVESQLDREYTNLAGAMKLAQASFPHDAAKRIVILSDANENIGDSLDQARALADSGVGIDVVPIRSLAQGEVAVEKVAIPSDVRRGQPFDLRVVLNNTAGAGGERGPVKGKLQVVRKTRDHDQTLAEEAVTLEPGKRVFTIREEIDNPDFYTYEARFVPDQASDDAMPQNNRATAFTHVQGSGQVLLIEDYENKGEYDLLVTRLRALNLEVTVMASRPEELFADLSQLQPYDTVLLANVPREHFTDQQIQMLVRNTQNMASGLVMLGGPNSFGAGGWSNTPIEEAMPVDFQIKNAKVAPVGALALLMHASEMADGNHWQKVIAREALKTLGNQDYCGVIHWNGNDQWLWNHPNGLVQVANNKTKMLATLDRMTPGDMPAFDPAMQLAQKAFNALRNQAAVKHMIIISDGDPAPPNPGVITALKRMGVKVSTVGVGTHGPPSTNPLQAIATQTGGKFYNVTNPNMLPRIYQKEARRVARPLVYEKEAGFAPQINFPHEMIQGIGDVLPPITGFVLTTVKQSPLVEVSLVSPQPGEKANSTILASWTYGLGKTAAMTTDAGKRWATSWTGWEGFDKLFSQLVRWSMRPVGDTGKFTLATEVVDGKIKVIVTALDKDDEFINFLNMGGTIVGPDMKPLDLSVKQVAPGRYVGETDATEKGSYFLMLSPGPGRAPIRAGVNIPYSEEFRDRQTNEGLLTTLAGLVPKQGEAGKVIEDTNTAHTAQQRLAKLLETNTFRHDLAKASSGQDMWHVVLLLGSCLFLADVFIRRVTVNFDWVRPLSVKVRDKVLRRKPQEAPTVTLDRLRSRKAEVGEALDQKRAAVRFEPTSDQPVDPNVLKEESAADPATPKPAKPGATLSPEEEKEQADYTSRLLKAKKKMWDERDKP